MAVPVGATYRQVDGAARDLRVEEALMVAGSELGAPDRYRVYSVARALKTLELLADFPSDQGMSVTEVADAVGVSKSAAFAILQTLLAGRYVSDEGVGQHRRYRLGWSLIRLGDRARMQTPLGEVARPALRSLADKLMLSVRFGVLMGNNVAIIERADVAGGLRIDLRMGDEELLHSTAIGKALLAAHTDSQASALLRHASLVRRTAHTMTDVGELIRSLGMIRSQGYAVDDEEDFEGITCIGAAVLGHGGIPMGAISVTTLKVSLTGDRLDAIGRSLASGAAQISSALGYSEPEAQNRE